MQEIFVRSQWDTLFTYLQQGRPPLWVLLAVVNGGFLAFWLYARITGDRPLRPATMSFMRGLIFFLNTAIIFSDDTLRMLRPFLRYFI
jgi:hypothetical protein